MPNRVTVAPMPLSMDYVLSQIGSPSDKTRLAADLINKPSGSEPGKTDIATLRICFQLLDSARAVSHISLFSPLNEFSETMLSLHERAAWFTELLFSLTYVYRRATFWPLPSTAVIPSYVVSYLN